MIFQSQEFTALVVLVIILAIVLIFLAFWTWKEAVLLRSMSGASPFERALAEQQPQIKGFKMPKWESSLGATGVALAASTATESVVARVVLAHKAIDAALRDIEDDLRKRGDVPERE